MTAPAVATPLVSVVLPAFNRLKFLRPAIESVFAQTFEDWELVIADDGSNEDTRAYLRSLEIEPHVSVIWLPHSGNPSAVRNAGVRAARGEYVAFMDSDDKWMPLKLERQIAGLQARGVCRWSYTGYACIDASGEPRTDAATRQWIPYRGAILEHLLAHAVGIWTSALVVERRLLEEVGGFDEQLLLYEDYDLCLRLACHSEIDLIDEPLICMRSHDQHYNPAGASMLTARHGSLEKIRRLVTDPGLRSLVERLCAESIVHLASLRANTDRVAAARTLLGGCIHGWRCRAWWTGLLWVSLKLATPRGLLGFYRRGGFRRRAVGAHSR
jgi:glycosyltransferase involved in cell wall biosynthesis